MRNPLNLLFPPPPAIVLPEGLVRALTVGDPVRVLGLWHAPVLIEGVGVPLGWGRFSRDPTRAEVYAAALIRHIRANENRQWRSQS